MVIELGRADLQDAHDLLGEERRGTGQILSAVCDCSFKMSDELCLTDPSPQLHALLCCWGSPNDLFGRCVDGFKSQGDSQKLRESVARAQRPRGGGQATAGARRGWKARSRRALLHPAEQAGSHRCNL